jgi:hypothetical protein
MKRPVILTITVVAAAMLVSSLFIFIEVDEQSHVDFISERTAEKISGQKYTLSSLTTATGSALQYAPYGEKILYMTLYTNITQFTANGTFLDYFFQDDVLEFNTTEMALTVYELESGILYHGGIEINYPTENGTYKGFNYTYATLPQNRSGSGYFWGTAGYSGDFVFVITGQSPTPPDISMSAVAIDQINAMT